MARYRGWIVPIRLRLAIPGNVFPELIVYLQGLNPVLSYFSILKTHPHDEMEA